MLHGGPGGGANSYNRGYFSDEIEKDYAMVYLDQRGNGASQGNYKKSDLTLAQNSKDVYNLVLFLKSKYGENISVFIAGHSWGGITSAHALITTDVQNEVSGWIEIDGAHDYLKSDIEAIKLFQKIGAEEILANRNIDFWQSAVDRVNQIDTLNITFQDQLYLNSTGFKTSELLNLAVSDIPVEFSSYMPFLGFPTLSLASVASNRFSAVPLVEDSQNNPMTDRLHEVEIPSLFLWGKYDFVVPPALGESAYNSVNTTEKELVIFEQSGHSPMFDEPILFTEKVKAFVELYR